jgi:hypothetical protein
MFLKSAVLPFRKIWMGSARCAFRKYDGTGGIRELVFKEFPDRMYAEAYRERFYDMFEGQLTVPFGNGWATESKREVINLWLNTQLAHTGTNDPANKKAYEIDLATFNKCDARIGREKFEFLFRSSIGTVGWYYIEFEETLAFPLFRKLRDEQGMKPSFEADMALKYNPYPSPDYKIVFDDVFWHLSRETIEETFDRLLKRHRFNGVRAFLRALFPKKQEALTHVCEVDTLDAIMERSKAVILEEGSIPDGALVCRSCTNTGYGHTHGSIFFDVYQGRQLRFRDNSREVLNRSYVELRANLLEERKQQRQPEKAQAW